MGGAGRGGLSAPWPRPLGPGRRDLAGVLPAQVYVQMLGSGLISRVLGVWVYVLRTGGWHVGCGIGVSGCCVVGLRVDGWLGVVGAVYGLGSGLAWGPVHVIVVLGMLRK